MMYSRGMNVGVPRACPPMAHLLPVAPHDLGMSRFKGGFSQSKRCRGLGKGACIVGKLISAVSAAHWRERAR